MVTYRLRPVVAVLLSLVLVSLSGCAHYLTPEIGAIARPDARIELAEGGVQNAAWTTKDLTLTYSYAEAGNTFNLAGTLTFDQSLTYSFGSVQTFTLKMSFLDKDNKVLQTIDITPLIGVYSKIPDTMPVKASCPIPTGASAIAFNYFGKFKSGDTEDMGGAGWEIFYYPYE